MSNEKEILKEIVRYILKKLPDQHPFRLSRFFFLIDMEYKKRHGRRLTDFNYRLYPEAFYIENFPQFLTEIEGVEKVVETDEHGNPVRGYFRLTTGAEPVLDDDIRAIVDEVLERYGALDDATLNRLVVELPEYQAMLKGESEG